MATFQRPTLLFLCVAFAVVVVVAPLRAAGAEGVTGCSVLVDTLSRIKIGVVLATFNDITDINQATAYCCATRGCIAWTCDISDSPFTCTLFAKITSTGFSLYYTSGDIVRDADASSNELGCFQNEFAGNAGFQSSITDATHELCAADCCKRAFPVSALQGTTCFCAEGHNSGGGAAASACDTLCPGNISQACGSTASNLTTVVSSGYGVECSDYLPLPVVTSPLDGEMFVASSTASVTVSWNFTKTAMDFTCWTTGFFVQLTSAAYSANASKSFALTTATGTFEDSETFALVPCNTEQSPSYNATVWMTNHFDATTRVSDAVSFCVAQYPTVPEIVSPASLEYITTANSTVLVSWSLSDPGFPCATPEVSFEVSAGLLKTYLVPIGTTSSTNFSWTDAFSPASFFVRVMVNNSGIMQTSVTTRFYTCFGTAPANDTAVTPAEGTVFQTSAGNANATVTLGWTLTDWVPSCGTAVASSTRCDVFIGRTSTSVGILAAENVSCGSAATVEATLGFGEWFWRVVPVVKGERREALAVHNFSIVGCGDGVLNTAEEECDGGSGCSANCTCGAHWVPLNPRASSCMPFCGDGVVVGNESCDGSPGCSSNCTCIAEEGYYPAEPAAVNCTARCSDGIVVSPFEECETGGLGCSSCSCSVCFAPNVAVSLDCKYQNGAFCTGETGHAEEFAWCVNGSYTYKACPEGYVCSVLGFHETDPCAKAKCGDGIVSKGEECDGGEHCTPIYCQCETGYVPTGGLDCALAPVSSSAAGGGGGPLSLGAIIGIAVAGAVVLAAALTTAIVLGVMAARRKKKKLDNSAGDVPMQPTAAAADGGNSQPMVVFVPVDGTSLDALGASGMAFDPSDGGGGMLMPFVDDVSAAAAPISFSVTSVPPPPDSSQ